LITLLLTCTTREQRHFIYVLCNARVKIENVFGIWKRRFPSLRQQLRFKLSTNLLVITACSVLYNIARKADISVPDGGDENDNNVSVPVPPNANQGGQALRAILIRHFQWDKQVFSIFIIFYQNKINNILNEVDDSTQVTVEQVNSILNNLDTLLVNSATTVFGINKQVCHQDLLVNHGLIRSERKSEMSFIKKK
jgi:hypothetical protein